MKTHLNTLHALPHTRDKSSKLNKIKKKKMSTMGGGPRLIALIGKLGNQM